MDKWHGWLPGTRNSPPAPDPKPLTHMTTDDRLYLMDTDDPMACHIGIQKRLCLPAEFR